MNPAAADTPSTSGSNQFFLPFQQQQQPSTPTMMNAAMLPPPPNGMMIRFAGGPMGPSGAEGGLPFDLHMQQQHQQKLIHPNNNNNKMPMGLSPPNPGSQQQPTNNFPSCDGGPMVPPFPPNFPHEQHNMPNHQQQQFVPMNSPHFNGNNNNYSQGGSSVNSPSMTPNESCRGFPPNLPPCSASLSMPPGGQGLPPGAAGMIHFQHQQQQRFNPSPFMASPPCSSHPQPAAMMCLPGPSSAASSVRNGSQQQQQFNPVMFDQQQPQQRPPSQQQQRIFVFTTALVNRAIDSNCSSLAEWHAQNIQQQPSTSAAPPPSMNHHPLEMSCGGMNFSLGQHPTAVLSPNVNNVNSAAATPTTTTATTTTTTKRATKRKIPHSNSESSSSVTVSSHSSSNFPGSGPGQSQSVPAAFNSADAAMGRIMNDSGAPLSAPDPSSFGGDFRRPPSLNHPPGSVGGIGNNNNYLSSSPTIGTPGLEDNPLKQLERMTTKCEPSSNAAIGFHDTRRMEMAAANNKFEMSRLPQCVDGNNSIVENMERKQKMDFLEAVEKQMQMEEGRRDCNGLPNGIRPMDFCNGSNNLPPGMMGPGGPGCPPPGMQFDPHQQQQQMVMIARQQGMQPICLNGGGPPFPGGPPHHMAPHPHHPQFFGVGPGGEMQQIHPGMRPQHMHMRHPMMSPHHHHQMMNGPQSQTGGPMMGPQQQQQMMPPGMMNHHSPMFPPPAGSGGPQQLQQQMNFGGGEGPPPNQQQHQLFYQQQQQQQQGGGAGIPRMNGGFPSPAEQFAAHQNGGMMPPPNGILRPNGPCGGGMNGEPPPQFMAPNWPPQGGPPMLPQPLANLDSRVPVHKMQYFASPIDGQQQHNPNGNNSIGGGGGQQQQQPVSNSVLS